MGVPISPQMAMYGISAVSSIVGGKKQKRRARAAARQAREDRERQRAILEEQKQKYREFEFSNPYAGMQTQFENPFEDLRVNTQQAGFMAQQGAQQRANILGSLRGAAGSSGIAGLAQTMANQGALQAQQISATIGQQEAANERARATGAMKVQQMESQADLQVRGGEAMLQEAESGREATILGMEYGLMAGENEAYQQSLKNFQEAQASQMKMRADAFSNLTKMTEGKKWSDFGFG